MDYFVYLFYSETRTQSKSVKLNTRLRECVCVCVFIFRGGWKLGWGACAHLCVLLQRMQSPWQHCVPAAKSWEDYLVPPLMRLHVHTAGACAGTHTVDFPSLLISQAPHLSVINLRYHSRLCSSTSRVPSVHLELEQEMNGVRGESYLFTLLTSWFKRG